ncbi:peptidoglycan DD-metalloendopeptidase family protein [Helicobacter sp. faydin-H76]|uniref:Peptidoglycan DD-metalloendopeptidase family protein n=1 Tax=Helicobacter cappadocius TaxID=3063998 RepID=A0AA90SSM5_9HELI|nr:MULTISPECIES: peptidoglycan DD-metalloendopeptidase family protein [unclassified Helicobacter]MDO7252921.1 peptidoglycan DD-metalloendopeptidase family protein [Helicobacter sp. faydin-H75]MDP2539089.1 peptidoglycan DD-metalloendopeptidase family protein [Helicobacter sp. faydin-H76]
MKKILLIFLLLSSVSFGAIGEKLAWDKGTTLLAFFEQNSLPLKLYYNLSSQDKELTAEIYAGVSYYVLKDDNGDLLQALIPISEDVQIHIYKDDEDYKLDFIPIVYTSVQKILTISVQKSPYQDIIDATSDVSLANEFINAYKKSINFKKFVIKDDKLAIIYTRKYRLGKPFGSPDIKASVIETNKKSNYIFAYKGRYYDKKGKEVAGFLLEVPVNYTRISSKFSYGRLHPILKIIRPHYGVDYAARIGTPIRAAADGKIIYVGVKGGYGKTIEINNGNGIKTLYAHMSSFAKGIHNGMYVKKGQIIGKVGTTGVSTGPHLHFGVYKNNRPINPLGSIRTAKSELKGKDKQEFNKIAQTYMKELDDALEKSSFEDQKSFISIKD